MPNSYQEIDITALVPDPSQPRKTFPAEAIERLAASIKKRGVLDPLRVICDAARESYLVATGESRLRAAKVAGLTHVPCIVVDALDEADLLADRLTENLLRLDLTPMEEAAGIAKLKRLKGCSGKALAELYGFSTAQISRAEALLSLPDDIQARVNEGRIGESAAVELSRLPDEQTQRELANAIAEKRLTRDQVTREVQARVGKRKTRPQVFRLACLPAADIAVTVSSDKPLAWESLLDALAQLCRRGKELQRKGDEVAALARSCERRATAGQLPTGATP